MYGGPAAEGILSAMLLICAFVLLALDLNAITYAGLWYGLTVPHSAKAVARTVWHILILPWIVAVPLCLLCGLLVPFWFVIWDLSSIGAFRRRLEQQFRQIIAQPYAEEHQTTRWWPFERSKQQTAALPPRLSKTAPPAS